MKRCFIYMVMTAVMLCALPAQGTSVHDNYVYFEGTSYLDFRMTGHHITSGQPWDGIDTAYGGDGGRIIVSAGRHGSDDVADWFNDRADLALGTRHDGGTGHPDQLNFAIHGDLILEESGSHGGKVIAKGIAIGQGHVGAYNNWWIGAEDSVIKEMDGEVWLECPAQDGYGAGIVILKTSGSDTFEVEVHSCTPTTSPRETPRVYR